jgi:hypothetical protein
MVDQVYDLSSVAPHRARWADVEPARQAVDGHHPDIQADDDASLVS